MSANSERDTALQALRAAQQFIRNGVALGYIRMPDADCPDRAHATPKLIDAAIAALSSPHTPPAVEPVAYLVTWPDHDQDLRWEKPESSDHYPDGPARVDPLCKCPPAQPVEPVALTDAQIDAIVLRETGFDSDYTTQAMSHEEMRRVARAVQAKDGT